MEIEGLDGRRAKYEKRRGGGGENTEKQKEIKSRNAEENQKSPRIAIIKKNIYRRGGQKKFFKKAEENLENKSNF